MFLGGEIEMSAPDFEKKEITVESDVSAEFYLSTKKGKKPAIDDFGISVEMNKDKEVTITTNIEDEDIIGNFFVIGIESKGIGGITLSLSVEQVNALMQVLGRFRDAYYAVKALAMERVVKSD